MAWSGGVFSRIHNWVADRDAAIKILAARHDAEDDNLATGINNCVTKDGQNAATSNLPMGGFKHTGVGAGTERNHYAAISQVQDGGPTWLDVSSSGNVIAASATPSITAYAAGQSFRFLADATLASGGQINISAVGARNIFFDGAIAASGDIVSGRLYQLDDDGTQVHATELGMHGLVGLGVAASGGMVTKTSGGEVLWGGPTSQGVQITAASGSPSQIIFDALPTWVWQITMTLTSISGTGSNHLQFQLGDAEGQEGTGYSGCFAQTANATAVVAGDFSTAFRGIDGGATHTWHGAVTFTRMSADGRRWSFDGQLAFPSASQVVHLSGHKQLSARLHSVSLRWSNTDTFDTGLVNIVYH